MRRSLVALVPAAAGLLLAACVGDRDTTAPKSAPDAAAFSRATPPQTCSANTFTGTMKQNAGDFFFAGNDPVFDMITAMKNSWQTNGAGAAATTTAGLNILARVALVRLTSGQVLSPASKFETAEVAGGNLVSAVALCMTLGPVDATTATTALRLGVFEVRGLATDPQVPALAKPDVFPRWGVESTSATWPTSPAYPRYLILGVPGAAAGELGGEPLAVSGFVGYDVSSLPASAPKGGLRVGICVKVTDADGNAVNRLIHGGGIVANSAPTFCNGALTASLSTSAWFASVANRLTSVFTPAVLHAQGEGGKDFDSFTGGGPSSWSPMAWGKIKGTNVGLSFKTQPKNGFNTSPLAPFVVHTATLVTPGHALEGTPVTITVFGNNGVPAGATVSGTLTVNTDANGDATFTDITVNKAGGYTLTATATYGGVPTQTAISVLFNIKNK